MYAWRQKATLGPCSALNLLLDLRVIYATAMSVDSAGRWAEQRHARVYIMLQRVIDPVGCAHCYKQ